MSIIIFGAGRMGLSHGSMSVLTDATQNTIFIEPSFFVRSLINIFTGKGVEARKNTDGISPTDITHAIIASPPSFHQQNLDALLNLGFNGRLLVEKPLQVNITDTELFSYVMSGYVLKHNFFWRELISDIHNHQLKSLTISLITNQSFGSANGNWRNSSEKPEVSFLYEFGSHCIDLLYCIVPNASLYISSAKNGEIEIKDRSVENIVIKLVSGSKTVRKSVYNIEAVTSDSEIKTDFYQYVQRNPDGEILKDDTLASLGVADTSYLRGFDFSRQMSYFLGEKLCTEYSAKSALKVDQVLKQLECEI